MSAQTRSSAPARATRVKSGKPPRKGTAARSMAHSAGSRNGDSTSSSHTSDRGASRASNSATSSGSTWVKGKPKAGKLTGKTTTRAGGKPSGKAFGKPGAKKSAQTPAKRAKNSARSQERAKRFADGRGTETQTFDSRTSDSREERAPRRASRPITTSDSRAPRTAGDTRSTKFAPARRTDTRVDTRNSDTRPTNRRDARLAEIARGDGRPNFEPKKRTKFIPGGGRTGAPSRAGDSTRTNTSGRTSAPSRAGSAIRSSHSGVATQRTGPQFRASSSRSRTTSSASEQNFSNGHFAEDFGADDNYISDIEQETTEVALHHKPTESTGKTWAELGIAPALVSALTLQGITAPFPIQVATLPDAIKGHDILGRGQTGSGKTLAFALAMLTNLEGKQAAPHRPLALILTPTRELAQQINDVITPLARAIRLDSVVIAGGMPYAKQITAMRKSCPILVATPGRLIDLLNRGEVQLDDLQITVLDEADQMADMGFLPVVKEILDQGRPNGQRLLFSATLDRGVDSLVKKYLNNPKTHSLQNDRASVSTMEHHVLVMHPGDKDEITAQIAARDGRTILFVKTQRGADRLADKLASVGVAVGALHGGKSQAVRTRTLAHFKASANAALVATDVAARGIHVDGISLVVHVDAPTDHKDYLHRAGRTARAGEAGVVVTLATSKQQTAVRGLTSRAGVYPKFVDVRPHHAELVSITGSREPSGIAYVAPVTASDGPRRSGKPRPRSDQRRRRPR